MNKQVHDAIVAKAMEPQALEDSIQYLAEHLGRFLRVRENVLICFQQHTRGSIGWLMEQAVLRCNAVPHVWGTDQRWKTLLRQAFVTKSTTIIGAPLLVLGLTKLKKAYNTPLYVRKVVTAGYPSMPWMIDGIMKGFDCEMGGCYSLGTTAAVAGFACGKSWGVHLREDVYGIDIVDDKGVSLPNGETGEIVIYPKSAPYLRFSTGENGRLVTEKCACGSDTTRIMDFIPGKTEENTDIFLLGQELQKWTSVLDCKIKKGEYGLEITLVVIPGEKLPRLPSAAKMEILDLDLENQEPFWYDPIARSL